MEVKRSCYPRYFQGTQETTQSAVSGAVFSTTVTRVTGTCCSVLPGCIASYGEPVKDANCASGLQGKWYSLNLVLQVVYLHQEDNIQS